MSRTNAPPSNTAHIALGASARTDRKTFEVEVYYLVGPRVRNLAPSPEGKRLSATNGASGEVGLVDFESDRVIRSIKVGRFPRGIEIGGS